MKSDGLHIAASNRGLDVGHDKKSLLNSIDQVLNGTNYFYITLAIEIKLPSNYYQNYLGFEILHWLRTIKRIKQPIILHSPLPKRYFENRAKTDANFMLLYGRGTGYIEAPFTDADAEKEFKKIRPLTDASLNDLIGMLGNLKGIVVDKLTHDIKFSISIQELTKVFDSAKAYMGNVQLKTINFSFWQQKLIEVKDQNNEKDFLLNKRLFLLSCSEVLTEEGAKKATPNRNKYKVLVIDDSSEDKERVIQNLGEDFEIIATDNGEDALRIISKDSLFNIHAIISDWRLYKDTSNTYWQNIQGYEVLEESAKIGFRALFAITSLAEFNVNQIRNYLSVKIHLLKKENLANQEQWNLFKDILSESCKEVSKLRSYILQSAENWSKTENKEKQPIISLQQQYFEKWNSANREIYFHNIETEANRIWNYYIEASGNDYKGIDSVSIKFGLQLPTKQPELEPVLILRRIWLALWFNFSDAKINLSKERMSALSEKIHKILFAPGQLNKDLSVNANATAYKLCVKTYDVQKDLMLPEESAWLQTKGLK